VSNYKIENNETDNSMTEETINEEINEIDNKALPAYVGVILVILGIISIMVGFFFLGKVITRYRLLRMEE